MGGLRGECLGAACLDSRFARAGIIELAKRVCAVSA